MNFAVAIGFVLSWLLWYVPLYRDAMGRLAAEHGFALMHIVHVLVPVAAVVICFLVMPGARLPKTGVAAHLLLGIANVALIAGVGIHYVADHAAEKNVPATVASIMSGVNSASPAISSGALISIGHPILVVGLFLVTFQWALKKLIVRRKAMEAKYHSKAG